MRNKNTIFAESFSYEKQKMGLREKFFTYMKQQILEKLGYSDRIERMFGRGIIVALTGQRRVGKSCVMRRRRDLPNYDNRQ